MKIAYILGEFPSISENFISKEIVELEREGLEIQILALKKNKAVAIKKGRAKEVFYVSNFALFFNFPAHLNLVFSIRAKYFSVLWALIISGSFSFISILKSLKCFLTAVFFLDRIKKKGITHVHAHLASFPASIGMLMANLLDIPFSFTGHANDIYTTEKKDLIRKIKNAKFVITCTSYNKAFLNQLTEFDNNKIHHIYHGIDLSEWDRREVPVFSKEDGVVDILTIARLVEKKGLRYLVESIDILRKQDVKVRCSIIGDGPLKANLKKEIAKFGLEDCVNMLGPVANSEISSFFLKADLFVLPSLITSDGDRDGLPNVLLESLAVGVPVISTSVSAIPELITHMKTGFLVPVKDCLSIAKAVIRLKNDSDLYGEIIKNGRIKVEEEFSIKNSTDRIVQLFNSR